MSSAYIDLNEITKKSRQMLRLNVATAVLQGMMSREDDSSFHWNDVEAKNLQENCKYASLIALSYADALIAAVEEE